MNQAINQNEVQEVNSCWVQLRPYLHSEAF